MLGWLILFALMVGIGGIAAIPENPLAAAMRLTSIVFALLFVVGVLARAARGRAW